MRYRQVCPHRCADHDRLELRQIVTGLAVGESHSESIRFVLGMSSAARDDSSVLRGLDCPISYCKYHVENTEEVGARIDDLSERLSINSSRYE